MRNKSNQRSTSPTLRSKGKPRKALATPEFNFELPKGIRVLGRWKSSLGIGFIDQNTKKKVLHHFGFTELAKSCDSLITILIDLGYPQLASGKALREFKSAIFERAGTQKVCLPIERNGLMTFESDGAPHTAYIWNKAIYWFGAPVETAQPSLPVTPEGTDNRLSNWQTTIGQYCRGNPNLIVAICHAMSATLRQYHHRAYLVLLLVGPSSSGKTTVQKVVTGLASNPDLRDAIPQFNGSEPGFRQHLSQYPGQCVCYQDIQLSGDISKIIRLIFGLADSSSRHLKDGPNEPLNCVTIFSNERSIIEMSRCDHRDINGGLFARVFEIYADAPYGMFHDIHDADSSGDFAKHLHQLASQNAGVVWPAWIQAISDHWNDIEGWWKRGFPAVSKRVFAHVDLGNQLSAVDRRMVDELAYSAWIGIVANKLGILPFNADDIHAAFGEVITSQVARRGKGQTPLAKRAIETVRGYIDQNRGRFPPLSDYGTEKVRAGIVGYQHINKRGEELYLFFVESFNRIFADDFSDAIYSYLKNADFLKTSKNRGYQYQVRPPKCDKLKSFVAIKADICFDVD